MKTLHEIQKAIKEIKLNISKCELSKNYYDSKCDYFMSNLELNRLTQYKGQLSALKWILDEPSESKN